MFGVVGGGAFRGEIIDEEEEGVGHGSDLETVISQ
jgi:hypothetical protein